MLHKVFDTLPEKDRFLFLREVLISLSAEERRTLLDTLKKKPSPSESPSELAREEQDIEYSLAGMAADSFPSPQPIPVVAPAFKDDEAVAPAQQSRAPEMPEHHQLHPAPAAMAEPPMPMESLHVAMAETQGGETVVHKKESLVEDEFKKFLAQAERTSPKDIRLQLLGCFGLGAAALLVIVIMAVVGREVWEWLMTI